MYENRPVLKNEGDGKGTMTARKVKVETIGQPDRDAVILLLRQYRDGWAYEVQDLASGPLPMPWRATTVAEAEEKLHATYDADVWRLTLMEED